VAFAVPVAVMVAALVLEDDDVRAPHTLGVEIRVATSVKAENYDCISPNAEICA
jgi:hypothetical protein